MSKLQQWLAGEVQSGRLSRRTPFRTWQVRFGPDTRTKRLWAYSLLHRWVWNYCREYQVYQELATDQASIQQWFRGEGVALRAIQGTLQRYNRLMRHWLLQGRRPYPSSGNLDPSAVSDSAHTLSARQMDAEGRRYILFATVSCAMAGAGVAAGGVLGPIAGAASLPGNVVSTTDTMVNGATID